MKKTKTPWEKMIALCFDMYPQYRVSSIGGTYQSKQGAFFVIFGLCYFSFQARSLRNSSFSRLSTVVSLPMWTYSMPIMPAQSFICSAVTS